MTQNNVYSTQESECEEKTLHEFSQQMDFFEELADFFLKIMTEVNQGKDSPHTYDHQDMAVIFLTVKNFRSLTCLQNTIKFGYYSESLMILRSVYESVHLCEYIMKNPDTAKMWWKCKRIPHSKVVKELLIPEAMQKMYGVLCDYTHSNVSSFIRDMSLESDFLSVQMSPVYRKKTAYFSIILQLLLTVVALKHYYEYFQKYSFIDFNSSHKETFEKMQDKYSNFMDEWFLYQEKTKKTEII